MIIATYKTGKWQYETQACLQRTSVKKANKKPKLVHYEMIG